MPRIYTCYVFIHTSIVTVYIDVHTFLDSTLLVTIVFDQRYVKERSVIDKHTRALVGFSDFGEVNNQSEIANKLRLTMETTG